MNEKYIYTVTILTIMLVSFTMTMLWNSRNDIKDHFSISGGIMNDLKELNNNTIILLNKSKVLGVTLKNISELLEKSITDLPNMIKKEIISGLETLANTLVDGIMKVLPELLMLIMKIIWEIIKTVYSEIVKVAPEIRYIFWGFIGFQLAPFIPILNLGFSLLSSFIPNYISVGMLISFSGGMYFYWKEVLYYFLKILLAIFASINWKEIGNRVSVVLKDLITEYSKEITNLF